MTVQMAVKIFEMTGFHNASQRTVLLEIAYRADRKGVVRASQSEIAEMTGLSRSTVAHWFQFFESATLLSRQGHGRYLLDVQELDAADVAVLLRVEHTRPAPGSDAELARIQGARQPNQHVAYRQTADGLWPVLVDD